MNIRPYAESDSADVVRLSLDAWAPVFVSIEQALDPEVFRSFYPDGWRVHQQKAVEAALASEEQNVWVAETEGVTIGFVSVALHDKDQMGEIHMVAVDPAHQGKGVGSALTAFALEWMRGEGMVLAMVETGNDPGHAVARRTYESAGFRIFPVARYFMKL